VMPHLEWLALPESSVTVIDHAISVNCEALLCE